jgi:drug/metabolite transporter (DMT)-like permease
MRTPVIAWLLGGVILAALGQVLFKLGATGRVAVADFLNIEIAGGLLCYGVGTALWIVALSKAPLTVVYPFTALTFVIVYVAGVAFLGEATSTRSMVGVVLVLAGLFLLAPKW